MPYRVTKSPKSGKWVVQKLERGRWVPWRETDTKKKAQAMIRAIYANEKGAK